MIKLITRLRINHFILIFIFMATVLLSLELLLNDLPKIKKQYREQSEKLLEKELFSIQKNGENYIRNKQMSLFAQNINFITTDIRFVSILVLDEFMYPLLSTKAELLRHFPKEYLSSQEWGTVFYALKERGENIYIDEENYLLTGVIPIDLRRVDSEFYEEKYGVIIVRYDYSYEITDKQYEIFYLFIRYLHILIVLAFVVWFVFSKYIVKPLQKLEELASGIKNGRFDTKYNLSAPREIMAIGKTFNVMSQKINTNNEVLTKTINAQPHIVIISNGHKMVNANKAFFEFLEEYANLEHFLEHYNCICNLFIDTDKEGFLSSQKSGEIWIEHLAESDKEMKCQLKKGGKVHTFIIKISTEKFDNVIHYIVALVDVTELFEIQERLNDAIDGTNDGLWDWDLVNNTLFFSKRWKKMLGYEDSELENNFDTWLSRVHPDDLDKALKDIEDNNKNITPLYENRHRLRHKDGSWVWILDRGKTVFDESGKAVRMVGFHTDITELITTQIELEKTNEKFEKAFQNSPNFIMITDMISGEIYAANDTFFNLFGFTKEEVLHKTVFDIGLWNEQGDRKHFVDNIGNTHQATYSIHKKDKSIIRAKLDSSAVLINQANCILTVGEDITEREKLEKILNQKNERIRQITTLSPFSIEVYDLEGTQIEVNDAYEKLWGLKREDTLNIYNLFMSEEVEKRGLLPYIKRAYSGEIVDVPEFEFDASAQKILQGKGNKNYLKSTFYPLMDENGEVESIAIVHENITETKKALQKLEQKKRELESIIEEAPNPIMLHNEDGKVLIVNRVWRESTGYTQEEIKTIQLWLHLAYGEDENYTKSYLNKLYKLNKRVEEGEFELLTKSGKKLTWTFISAPLGIIDGKKTIISSAMDISTLKEKDELIRAQSRFAAMGEMIGMIAHQWRQPIAGISMDINNLLLDIELGEFNVESAKQYSYNILSQTTYLSKTIDDFRNFFKPDKTPTKINLNAIIDETYSLVKDALKNNNISFEKIADEEIYVEVYPRELMQMFVNIINNSKDAIVGSNQDNGRITAKIYSENSDAVVEITDNGGGVDEQIIQKIFDPYFSTKDDKSGTGLGLYISKMIIEDHLKGRIVGKNTDDGFSIKVCLPMVENKVENGK